MTTPSLHDLIEKEFANDNNKLPVFNRVALELQQLKNSNRVSIQQIAHLIMCDQALAGKILQTANSSFYGGLKQVTTMLGAVQRLGVSRVASLAMVASQLLIHTSKLKIVAHYMPGLWQRSLLTATGARWLAQQMGHGNNSEEMFLVGLMHNIGELFLLKALEVVANNKNNAITLTDALIQEILASMHTDIGYRLIQKWELSPEYAIVARDHHLPEFDENNTMLAAIRLVNLACQKLGIDQTASPNIVLAATTEAQVLGLKEITLAQLEVLLEDNAAAALQEIKHA